MTKPIGNVPGLGLPAEEARALRELVDADLDGLLDDWSRFHGHDPDVNHDELYPPELPTASESTRVYTCEVECSNPKTHQVRIEYLIDGAWVMSPGGLRTVCRSCADAIEKLPVPSQMGYVAGTRMEITALVGLPPGKDSGNGEALR